MSIAYLKITNQNGFVYNFPAEFWLESGGISNNINVINKFFTAGGGNVADGFLQARTISISGILRADTPAALDTLKEAFTIACLDGGDLTISDDLKSRFITVKNPSFNYSKERGRLYQEISVDFLAEFPFWQDVAYTEHPETITGDTSFIVDTTGTVDLVAPIIIITSTDSGGLPGVTMRNITDGGNGFVYSDSLFQLGDVLIIDSGEGTVKLNNTNREENFNPAVWLRLQRGLNTIQYEGGGCTMVIKYRKKYLLNG